MSLFFRTRQAKNDTVGVIYGHIARSIRSIGYHSHIVRALVVLLRKEHRAMVFGNTERSVGTIFSDAVQPCVPVRTVRGCVQQAPILSTDDEHLDASGV